MKKAALFVEGQTELIFAKKLLSEIAGKSKITFIEAEKKCGKVLYGKPEGQPDSVFMILIVDCHGDHSVKSTVLDQRASLSAAGYCLILGLRDVHPKTAAEIPVVEAAMKYGVPTKGVKTRILLAVMEIEAWFLAETSHFIKMDAALTKDYIIEKCGIDHDHHDFESVEHPSKLLHEIYSSAGLKYLKKRSQISKTVESLDFANIYLNMPNKYKYLKELVGEIDEFIG
jgi:hypothetical protein